MALIPPGLGIFSAPPFDVLSSLYLAIELIIVFIHAQTLPLSFLADWLQDASSTLRQMPVLHIPTVRSPDCGHSSNFTGS